VARSNRAALIKLNDVQILSLSITNNAVPDSIPIQATKRKIFTAMSNVLCLCAKLNLRGAVNIIWLHYKFKPTTIWLDSSLLGILIPIFRLITPGVRIICYFHNIERTLVAARIKTNKVYFLAYIATAINEYISAKLSNVVLTTQSSDALQIQKDYSIICTDVIPVSIEDSFSPQCLHDNPLRNTRYVLFVGSDFPPNIEALEFLDQKVAPLLRNTRILAIGNGLERHGDIFRNIIIRGRVENLQAYYHYASAVVAPIFSGGGMKVKIAEALMHNKTIISTKFAAVGYEEVNSKVIVFARTPLEFAVIIDAIAQPKDQESRSYYVKYYSAEAIAIKINRIVQGGSESDTHNH